MIHTSEMSRLGANIRSAMSQDLFITEIRTV